MPPFRRRAAYVFTVLLLHPAGRAGSAAPLCISIGNLQNRYEVDWAGDPAHIIDPDTGEILDAHIFVGVMTYSQYPYVEAFMDEKQPSWIAAHVHMYEYFGGVAKILVPDNCRTAVDHNKGWKDQRINAVYQEMAEHYGTAIIPARIRTPRDKANVEGSVGNISTWITAALRNEQFFSLSELNRAIRQKLEDFSHRPFQKKEGSPVRDLPRRRTATPGTFTCYPI